MQVMSQNVCMGNCGRCAGTCSLLPRTQNHYSPEIYHNQFDRQSWEKYKNVRYATMVLATNVWNCTTPDGSTTESGQSSSCLLHFAQDTTKWEKAASEAARISNRQVKGCAPSPKISLKHQTVLEFSSLFWLTLQCKYGNSFAWGECCAVLSVFHYSTG